MERIDFSWLEDGGYSTAQNAQNRLGVSDKTVRLWAQAGFIRYAPGRPMLLCDEDIDKLAELLRGIARPTIAVLRSLKDAGLIRRPPSDVTGLSDPGCGGEA